MKRSLLLGCLLIVALLAAAYGVRMVRLGTGSSLTTDEVTTVTNSARSLAELWRLEQKTPLQALWVRLGTLATGRSEFAVSYLSVMIGVLAVAVTYRLGRALFGYRAALLGAAMLAFSAYHVYWSRSPRYYALMVLLSALAFWCLVRAVEGNRPRAWLGYALFRTLSLYDHLTAVWMLTGEGAFAAAVLIGPLLGQAHRAWRGRRTAREGMQAARTTARRLASSRAVRFAAALGLIALAYLPRSVPMVRDIAVGRSALRLGGESTEQVAPENLRAAQPRPVLGGGWRGPFVVLSILDAWNQPLHLALMAAFAGGVLACGWRRRWRPLTFTLAIMVTPLALALSIKTYGLVLNARYLISLLPVYFLMAGQGLVELAGLAGRAARRWVPARAAEWAAVGVCIVAIAGLSAGRIAHTHYTTGHNWKAVARFLERATAADEPIVVEGEPIRARALSYYLPGRTVIPRDPSVSYEELLAERGSLWLVYEPGTNMYTGARAWTDTQPAGAVIFRGGWFPDIERTSEVAPAQSWDLWAVHAGPVLTPTQEALAQHERWLAQAEGASPGAVRRHLTLAEAYRHFGRPDLAVGEYSRALTEGFVNEQLASYIYAARAASWQALGSDERAAGDLRRAIASAPWSEEPYRLLVEALRRLGRDGEAEAVAHQATADQPKKAWPYVLLGNALRLDGRTQEAASEYRRGIEVEPSQPAAYQRLAELYTAGGEPSRAAFLLREAAARFPWFGWPHLLLGQQYQNAGAPAEAVAEYRRAAELQPELAPACARLLRDLRWDVWEEIRTVRAHAGGVELVLWPGSAWVKPRPSEPDVLVGRSTLSSGGVLRPNQLFLSPFSAEQSTVLEFAIADNPFVALQAGFGLADEVAGKSNGVRYTIEVRAGSEGEWTELLATTVTQAAWQEQTLPLDPVVGRDAQFRMTVDALGDFGYDWLQATLALIPPAQVGAGKTERGEPE